MTSMNPRQSRTLAVGLFVVVLLLLVLVVIKPAVSAYLSAREEISALEHQISVLERVAATLPDEQVRLDELRANNPVSALHFPQDSPSLATAALQQHLNRVIGRAGGQLVSTQIQQKSSAGPLPTIAISVHMRCEVDEFVRLLHALESGTPLLFIENLVIASTNVRGQTVNTQSRTRRNPQRQRKTVAALDVRFELIGYGARAAL